jgi:hypothetical protein
MPAPQVAALVSGRSRAGVDLGLFFPSLHRESWDVAVANQSASWMDAAELRRLSGAYVWTRDNQLSEMTQLFSGPRFVDAMTDARVGVVEPREFLRVVHQATVTLRAAVNRYEVLEDVLHRALGEPKRGAAAG